MTSRCYRDLLVLGAAIAVLALDQWSKHWVRQNLVPGVPYDPVPWLRPVLSLTYVTNTGVAFGLFPQLGRLYALVALAVVAVIIVFYRRLEASSWPVAVGVGMVIGGALGNNVIDRLWHGRIVDFLDLNFWPLHEWPVFNVADSAIVVGMCILAIFLLFSKDLAPGLESPPSEGDEHRQ